MLDFDDELELMEEDYVFDGWREGQDYYDSVYPDEEGGIVMTEKELKEVTYTRQGNSDKWDVEVLNTYPILSKNGNIVVAKDLDGSKFTAKVTRDKNWNATELGEPITVEIISK